jgi:hypothetical protein
MEFQHASDVNMANDIATNKSSQLTNMQKDLMYISLRQNEDSKYDVKPPERKIIKETFVNSQHETLAIIAICLFAALIIVRRK